MFVPIKVPSVVVCAVVAIASLWMPQAQASVLSAATILQDFNAVVYTNASTTADIEGATVVGGNFGGATMYSNPTQSQPAGFGALTVFGNLLQGNGMNMDNGGSAYVAGTKSGTISFNGGGGYLTTSPGSITNFETPLNALSGSLSALTANNTFTVANNNNSDAFNVSTSTNGIAVFDVTASELSSMNSYQINPNGASTVIINVSGTSVNIDGNLNSTAAADNVIWNFYQASSVTLQTQIEGTILATGATVTNDNQIDGTLVANAWNGQGELHDYGFTGVLPATNSVPEPGDFALVIAGIGSLLLVRRNSLGRAMHAARAVQ